MKKEPNRAHSAIYETFKTPDAHSIGVFKMLEEVYPSLAKKIFTNRTLLGKLVMTNLNPLDVLDYPMCSACEQLAFPYEDMWRKGKLHKTGRCDCGRVTYDPITFREWLYMELKRKAPPDFIDNLQYVVDGLGFSMMRKAIRQLAEEMERQSAPNAEAMGLYMPDGTRKPLSIHNPKPKGNVVKLSQDEAEERFNKLNIQQIGDTIHD